MDEEQTGPNPLDTLEAENGMRGLAHLVSVFFDALRAEGFQEHFAFELTRDYLHATVANAGNSE